MEIAAKLTATDDKIVSQRLQDKAKRCARVRVHVRVHIYVGSQSDLYHLTQALRESFSSMSVLMGMFSF